MLFYVLNTGGSERTQEDVKLTQNVYPNAMLTCIYTLLQTCQTEFHPLWYKGHSAGTGQAWTASDVWHHKLLAGESFYSV